MLVDTHAHLEAIGDLENVLKRAQAEGVDKIITIGTSLATSRKAVEIASTSSIRPRSGLRGASENIPEISATCGIHPQDGKADVENANSLYRCIDTLKQIAESSNKVVAIGECGLDYYLTGDKRITTVDKNKKFQRDLFESQIELAQKLKLPLVIHCRNGWGEIFDLIAKFQTPNSRLTGVFHSWTGDWTRAKKALNLGFYISFSGIVTFKDALEVQEVAKKAPLDRMLLETDSPFLSPEPLRSAGGKLGKGVLNEPKNVRIVGKFLADLRGQSFDIISCETFLNAQELFRI